MKKLFLRIIFLIWLFMIAVANASEPITLVTLTGPGSQGDTAARFFAPLIEHETGKPVVIINAPGGQGVIGMEKYLQYKADGNTLLVGNSSVAFSPKLIPNLGFDPMNDLEPVYGLSSSPLLVLVAANSPIKSMKDFPALFKEKGKLFGGSSVVTTAVSMGLMDKTLGIVTEVVNYKQPQELVLNLSSGVLDYSIAGTANSSIQGLLEAGKLRAVGVVGKTRSLQYPQLLTMKEQGFESVEEFSWTAFFINAKTDPHTKQVVTDMLKKVMNSDAAKDFENKPGKPGRFLAGKDAIRLLQLKEEKMIQ